MKSILRLREKLAVIIIKLELENLIKSEIDKVTPLRKILKTFQNTKVKLELQSLDEENTRIQDEIENKKVIKDF